MLGIVIANWNGEQLIDKCLESLTNQSFKEFKVYIVDNNSKDASKKIINQYKSKISVTLIELDKNYGFAKANNIGIKKAINDKCDYILTLNNDVEVPVKSLEIAMNEVNNSKYDIYQLFMINYFNRDKCDAAGLNFEESLIPIQVGFKGSVEGVLEEDISIEGVCAGAAIYSVKALEAVKLDDDNYFDSKFFAYYEDVDLSLRLNRAGFKAKLLKDSIVYHMHSATGSKSSGFKEYYLTRNLFLYTKRNQTYNKFKQNKKIYYIRFLKNLVKNINNPKVVKLVIKGLIDGLKESRSINYK